MNVWAFSKNNFMSDSGDDVQLEADTAAKETQQELKRKIYSHQSGIYYCLPATEVSSGTIYGRIEKYAPKTKKEVVDTKEPDQIIQMGDTVKKVVRGNLITLGIVVGILNSKTAGEHNQIVYLDDNDEVKLIRFKDLQFERIDALDATKLTNALKQFIVADKMASVNSTVDKDDEEMEEQASTKNTRKSSPPATAVDEKKTEKKRGRPKKAEVKEEPKSKKNKAPPVSIQVDEEDFFQEEDDDENLAISDKLSTMMATINSLFTQQGGQLQRVQKLVEQVDSRLSTVENLVSELKKQSVERPDTLLIPLITSMSSQLSQLVAVQSQQQHLYSHQPPYQQQSQYPAPSSSVDTNNLLVQLLASIKK